MITYDKLYIGGQWVAPSSNAVIDVVSPHSEEVIGRVPEAKEADIDRAVAAARDAFDNGPWQWTPPAERAALMEKLGAALTARSEQLATTITQENGCPIGFSTIAQVGAASMILNYFTQLARDFAF